MSEIDLTEIEIADLFNKNHSDEEVEVSQNNFNIDNMSSNCVEISINNDKHYLKILDFIINDLIVVFFSFFDVFLDLAVLYQFYIDDRMEYFQLSIIIFVISQFSYSFLFVATWGKYRSPIIKIAIFFITLPFSQLVPFFTWF